MLLAWDTSHRLNWGARGAHVATRHLLEAACDPLECLPGKYQTQGRPVNFLAPRWVAEPLWWRQNDFWFAEAYVELESALGGRPDFIDPRPDVSLRNILDNLDDEYIRRLYDTVRHHDTIVVDGDGDLIFKAEPRRNLLADLAVIALADYLDKEIYYVNSICSDCPVTGRNQPLADRCLEALKTCDGVAFRDPRSLQHACEIDPELDAEWIPDSMFYWHDDLAGSQSQLPSSGDFIIPYTREADMDYGQLDFSSPYICVTGGSRAAFTPEKAVDGYCGLVEHLRELNLPVYLVPTCAGDQFLHDVAQETGTPIVPVEVPLLMGGAILANARLFVTGRYHPSIMAASGGTPCVFLGADSHKTLSLQRLLGYDDPRMFSAVPDASEWDDIVEWGRDLLEQGQSRRDALQQAARQCAEEATRLSAFVNGG
jgi:hypothetical protein